MQVLLKSIQRDALIFCLLGLTVGERILVLRQPRNPSAALEGGAQAEIIGELIADAQLVDLTVPFGNPTAPDLRELVFAQFAEDESVRYVWPDLTQFQASSRVLMTGPVFQVAPAARSIAALTIAFNEDDILPHWAEHYGSVLGFEHLYVIDDGSDRDPRSYLPAGVNVIRQPRTSFDSWRLCRSLSQMQRFLLETYDLVLVLDSDEFLVTDRVDVENFAEHLRADYPWERPIVRPCGWELIHDIDHEKPLIPEQPILAQRAKLLRATIFDKPCITAAEISLFPGNHNCFEESAHAPELHLIHLRWFDLSFALAKGLRYTRTEWAQLDLAVGLSDHQRLTVNQIESKVRGYFEQYCQQQNDSARARELPDRWRKQLSF